MGTTESAADRSGITASPAARCAPIPNGVDLPFELGVPFGIAVYASATVIGQVEGKFGAIRFEGFSIYDRVLGAVSIADPPAGGQVVPEPGTGALALGGMAMMLLVAGRRGLLACVMVGCYAVWNLFTNRSRHEESGMNQLILHLIGDYVTQSDWMAQNKTKSTWAALCHATVYGAPFSFWEA